MSRRAQRAHTMIEMLIVMVIVCVLATAAMPTWQQHVVSTRRNEAQAMLLKLMLQQERYFTQNGTYIAFSSASTDFEAARFQWWSGNRASSSGYEIEGKACDDEPIGQCVQLVATAGAAMVDGNFRDDECRQMTLTSTGARLSAGTRANCWR